MNKRRLISCLMAVELLVTLAGCVSEMGSNSTGAASVPTTVVMLDSGVTEASKPPIVETEPSEAGEECTEKTELTVDEKTGSTSSANPAALAVTTPAEEPEPTDPKPTDPKPTEPKPTVHTHSYTETVAAPTCISDGYTLHECSCGDSYKDHVIAALGHSFGDWVITKEATTEDEGEQTRICIICGGVETQSTAKLETENIDTAALEAYGRSYAESTYGYCGNPGTGFSTNAGYFPPARKTILTMEDGRRCAREIIDAQYRDDVGAGHPITAEMDGHIVRRKINLYFEPTDTPNIYLVYCFYGGE